MITGEIKSQIDKIWNDFWTGGISNPLTVIEQFTYLIFLKQLDDKQNLIEKRANMLGVTTDKVVYTPEQKELRWSSFREKDPEVMFELFTRPQRHLNDVTVFDFMKTLGKDGGAFTEYIKGATFMIPTAKLLDRVVQQIDKLPLDNRDTKGDLYEYMLGKIAEAGTNGQFRTPRHIIRMMVEMTQPKKDDTICDPSLGTAGFLVAASEYIHDRHEDWFMEQNFREHFNTNMFNGIEIDPSMMRIASMNLQLHGIETPQLLGNSALSESNDISSKFSLVLANPPFKGALDYDEVESSLLAVTKTKKTELLFLSLILRMLKLGGRAAVIVPDGVLFGSSGAHKNIRKELVENQQLQAVISMPSGVFKPYAGVSTAILFFTKTNSGGTDKVWFYDMLADGKSLDDKRNALVPDEIIVKFYANNKTEEITEDFIEKCNIPQIVDHWNFLNSSFWGEMHTKEGELLHVQALPEDLGFNDFLDDTCVHDYSDRTSKSFLISKADIVANDYDLSINRYKEVIYDEVIYEKPAALIADIKAIDTKRQQAILELEKMLE